MKLNKEICKRCINEQEVEDRWKWKVNDDENWLSGSLDCPITFPNYTRLSVIPENCPYKMEHIIFDQNDMHSVK